MKKIVITGHTGFLGSNLVETLLKKYEIIGISTTKNRQNFTQIKSDIRNITLQELPKKIYSIIHLAAVTDITYCQNNPLACYDVNVKGTQNILEIARKKDSKFIFISTSHVYGIPQKLPIKEDHPRNPTSIYSASKIASEIISESFARTYGMDVIILRLFSIYGPYSTPHLIISKIISQLYGNTIRLGNVHPKRDFIYVKDVMSAIKLVLEKSSGFKIYNVGTGKSYSILEICNILKKITRKNIPVKSIKSMIRSDEIDDVRSDPSRIKKLGWRPQTNIKEGLELTLNWYLNNNLLRQAEL